MKSQKTSIIVDLDELANFHVNKTKDELIGEYTDLITEVIPYAISNFEKYGDTVPTEHVIKTLTRIIGYQRNCQYCDLTKRNKQYLQSELNDAYTMLDCREKEIKRLKANEVDSNELQEIPIYEAIS